MRSRPALLTISDNAAARLETLVYSRKPQPAQGVRIRIKTRGCSGYAYALEYVDVPNPLDEKIQVGSVDVYIDAQAVMYIIGSHMDYEETEISSGFVFRNPNEKGRCGCGESFHV